MNRRYLAGLAAAAWFLGSGPLGAEQTHMHGAGRLNMVVDRDLVQMELIAPGASIVGFEHAPASDEDVAKVRDAIADLQKGDRLFMFPKAAGCEMQTAAVHSGLAGEGEHGDFFAEYGFKCLHPDRLSHMQVDLFDHFPATEELDVQAVTASGQKAAELTPASRRLEF